MNIEYIQYRNINFHKWDECVSRSLNGLVYAYSWYLDIVAGEWDALVADDYSIIFPLVKGSKYGIPYLYQPYFTQQLGVFSPIKVDSQTTKLFTDSIPAKFKYRIINFNSFNNLQNIKGEIIDKVTYQLDLVQPYFSLSSKYNDNTSRNISKSIAMGATINKMLSVADYVRFKKNNPVVPLQDIHYRMLTRVMESAFERGIGEIYAAFIGQGELCAAAFFIHANGKVFYLSAASNESGKTNRAMFGIVDQFINDNSESHLILDFEGSSIESIARFYAGFGATRCVYQQLVVNQLPWYLKLIKR